MLPGCAIDQRIKIGQSAKRLSGNCAGQGGIRGWQAAGSLGRIVHRLATPQNRIEDPERGSSSFHAFLRAIGLRFIGRSWHFVPYASFAMT